MGGTGRRRPFVVGLFVLVAAAAIFLIGTDAGQAIYLAFEGDGTVATAFTATLATILVAIFAAGVWLDRRQRQRDVNAGPLTDVQRERLRSYVQPPSPLVRWYQPIAVAVFIALAAPGALLLDTPWDGIWVLAVLVANPVARWLRSQGRVLSPRDLRFRIPGLSPWPTIATTTIAAMAFVVLLEAGALDTTPATIASNIVIWAFIICGALASDRHQRGHINQLLGSPDD